MRSLWGSGFAAAAAAGLGICGLGIWGASEGLAQQTPPQEQTQAPDHGWAASAPSGVIAVGPPQDVEMTVSTGAEGEPVADQTEFALKTGGYYRFNFICSDAKDDTAGFRFEAPRLLANSHLRVVSAGDIEIHMSGLLFHALECDEPGRARFSFHPMRKGEYEFLVKNQDDPPAVVRGVFKVE